ncbi:MAG: hypothetical protein IPJ40_04860 [Saprospirales bacterium]|nr:hypothetical protein [Saprospirales bacterium]
MENTITKFCISLLVFLFFLPFSSNGQVIKGELLIGDTTQVHRVVTKRGDIFLGRITQIENTEVHFLFNQSIELTFQLQDLQEISIVDPNKVGRNYTYNESRKEYQQAEQPMTGHERGYYLPSGFLLPKGTAEYRNSGLFYNSIEYGVSDNINIGIGGIPLIVANAFQLKLRAGASLAEFLHVSANANGYFTFIIGEPVYVGGAGTGVVSIGSPERHLTLGGGYGFGFDNPANQGIFVAQAGGSYRFARSWRIFGEGIFPVNEPGFILFSVGVNWLLQKNRLEFGWSLVRVDSTTFPFPFIGYAGQF